MTLVLALSAAVLCGCGTWLMLDRHLSRVVVGVGLLGHGVNVVLLMAGVGGRRPAFVGGETSDFSDPLPQAMALTAIVITFGVIAFLLALAHRSWSVTGDDQVEDDIEDRRVASAPAVELDAHPADDPSRAGEGLP